MGRILFISDTHFGHTNMALKRGFSSAEEMNEHIIQKWNSKVNKKDTVFILGDITMEKDSYEILDRLNGYKKVVLGNHDQPQHIPKMLKYVNSVCGMYKKGFKEIKSDVILTHCPIHESEMGRFKFNIHGHCVDEDTEILTADGWKKYDEIYKDQEIYSVNPKTLLIEQDVIKNVIINEKYNGIVYSFSGKGIYMTLSEEHRVVYKSKTCDYIVNTIKDLEHKSSITIYKSFFSNNKGIDLSDDLLRLYIYLVADGNITTSNLCRFILKKERKINLIESLLKKLNIEYSKNSSSNFTRFNFRMPVELTEWKIKGLDSKLLNCKREQAEIIRQSYSETDGNRNLIFSSKKQEVDLLQQLFVLNGFQCKVHSRVHGFGKNTAYQLSVTDNQTQILPNFGKRLVKEEVLNKLMWCVSTKNQNFIARKNGSVFLTGNCHENSLNDKRYINVSCEVVDYTPKYIEEIIS